MSALDILFTSNTYKKKQAAPRFTKIPGFNEMSEGSQSRRRINVDCKKREYVCSMLKEKQHELVRKSQSEWGRRVLSRRERSKLNG